MYILHYRLRNEALEDALERVREVQSMLEAQIEELVQQLADLELEWARGLSERLMLEVQIEELAQKTADLELERARGVSERLMLEVLTKRLAQQATAEQQRVREVLSVQNRLELQIQELKVDFEKTRRGLEAQIQRLNANG
jgi:hypothetical protein